MPKQNRYGEAFKEPANVLGLAGLAALSFATLNPLPLIAGFLAEAVYLLFVPDTKWFMARLDKKYDAEVAERRDRLKREVWDELPYDVKERFLRLEAVRSQISSRTFEGKRWYREVLRKLDYMMEKFLLFGVKQGQFRTYLLSVLGEAQPGTIAPPPIEFEQAQKKKKRYDSVTATEAFSTDESVKSAVQAIQKHYQSEIEKIIKEMDEDENLHNRAVLDKRREVLTRRQEFVVKIGETLLNIRHQLDLMEDTFGMINDQVRTLSPEQVLADIETVVNQTDTLTERLQEVAPFDVSEVEKGADTLYDLEEGTR